MLLVWQLTQTHHIAWKIARRDGKFNQDKPKKIVETPDRRKTIKKMRIVLIVRKIRGSVELFSIKKIKLKFV